MNKIDLVKVYHERVKPELTPAEQKAMETALSAQLLSKEEIKRMVLAKSLSAKASRFAGSVEGGLQ